MSARDVLLRCCSLLVWLSLFAFSGLVLAQSDATPIQIGQNTVGALSVDAPTAQFTLTVNSGDTATVQVLALSPSFAPRFRILNPAGVEILTVTNPDGLTSLNASKSFDDAGDYLIEISGENGSTGQFVLSLQPGAPLPQPVDLLADQPISDIIGGSTPLRVYRFATAASGAPPLSILSETEDSGVLVSLFDEGAGKTIATNDATVSGVAYRLPPQERHYRLEIRAGGAGETAYSICLGNCGETLLSTQPQVVTVAETPEVGAGDCTVASSTGGSVNVRAANGTQYAIVGNLPPGGSIAALGQNASNGVWYEVSINGMTGWVSASVTRLDGDCGSLPQVDAPVGARLAPTQAPLPTSAPASSGGGSAPPSATPSAMPTTEPPAMALPDLTITIQQVYTEPVYFSSPTAVVEYRVENIGTAATGRTFHVTACIGNDCIIWELPAIGAGNSFTEAHYVPYSNNPPRISHTVIVTVDTNNVITESNENNNVATKNFQ